MAKTPANGWSSAKRPEQLLLALRNSHTLVTARLDGKLVGLGNAISDGHLVVYYPHMPVHPAHQGQGISRKMMAAMQTLYGGFHQQMLMPLPSIKPLVLSPPVKLSRCGSTQALSIRRPKP